MNSIHYTLCSNAYKNNIFAGFSQLQKHEDFVDLTLAADGHIVKVHRSLIALASPYLKEILRSMSHHSTVIFLNNVSHDVLTYMLNYIYLGEVNIPLDAIDAFIEACKSLQIAGIEDLEPPKKKPHPKLTAHRQKPTERKNNTQITEDNFTINNDTSIEEHLPTNFENNNFDKIEKNNLENQQQSDIINNANIIIQQDNENQIESCINNFSFVEIKTDIECTSTEIDCNISQNTAIPDQENTQNIPIIELTNVADADQNIPANTGDYQIIVRKDLKSEESNMPVLEIQHVNLTQETNTFQHSQALNIPSQTSTVKYFDLNKPCINIQKLVVGNTQDTTLQTNSIQQDQSNKPAIKILDKVNIKHGESMPLDCKMDDMKHMAQYSITERGALQLVLNRYIYCCHHISRKKQRWRCIDYRRGACKALVDTVDGAIVARNGLHAHPFHDNKIYKKHKNGLIFQSVEQAVAKNVSREKEGLQTLSIDVTDDDDLDMDT